MIDKAEPARDSRAKRAFYLLLITPACTAVILFVVMNFIEWKRDRDLATRERWYAERALGPKRAPTPENFAPQQVVGRMPVVTGFKIVDAAAGDEFLEPDEFVLGVELNGERRAYPINILTGPEREIFNDELAGTAIAATW